MLPQFDVDLTKAPRPITILRAVSRQYLLLCLLCSTTAFAQYRFDHWTAENGLPQNSVRDILQTRDGYLWLATFDGLARFDGVRFTVFNKSNSPGIITNRFILLYEDAQGNLWASTEDGALTRLHQGRFTTYTKGQGLPGERVYIMGDDGWGNLIVFFSPTQGYRWLQGRFQAVADMRSPPDSTPSPRQNQARRAPAGQMGRDDAESFVFIDGQLRSLGPGNASLNFLHSALDQHGQIWYSASAGLFKDAQGRLAPDETVSKRLPGKEPRLVYGQLPLRVMSVADDGALWLTELDSLESHLLARRPPEELMVRVKDADLRIVYGDREGNLWFGTLLHGLFRARRQTVTAYTKSQGLAAVEVYPILEDRAGTIWLGSAAEGLFRFQNGVFTRHAAPNPEQPPISSLFEDRAGRIWASGWMRLENGRLARGLSAEFMLAAPGFCWTMHEDREGAIWFGLEGGVLRYLNGVRTRFTTEDGLAGNDTKVIIEDVRAKEAGSLWLGSYGGLTHYKNGRFTKWTETDGLPGATVRALKQDNDGALWIGTYDSGLGRFKDGKFTRYTMNDGLFDNGVFQILEDDFGWMWMSCNRGIYRVRKQDLNDFADGKIKAIVSIAFGKGDGMENVECNGGRWPAGVKARDGKLWFPTMGGVAVIDPASVRANTQPPPVVIEAMTIDNKAVALETWQSAIRDPRSAIEITPRQSNFEIQYTALSFINAENIRFKYKLEGLDQDWIEAGMRRTAYFSHVAPGSYTFRVIAANSDGVWNTEGQSLRIAVLPPFYRTWWFLTLSAFAVAGLALGLFQYRVAQVEKRRAAQQAFTRQLIESQEAERKRIAAGLHDSLGQQLLVIKNWAMIGLGLSQEGTREPLDEISATASRAIEEVRQVIYDLRPYQLDKIGLSNTLRFMIEKVATASGIAFTTEIGQIDDLFPHDAQVTLYRIVQECINNIAKHSQATAARVAIAQYEQTLSIFIEDNGRGFGDPQAAISNPQSSGLGLTSLRERVQMLGGRETIHSAPGNGAKIEITIELKPKL